MAPQKFDLIVIGGGPGGYVAAIRAAQYGMKVALVERNQRLGGTCLRVGCIPSKALLESSERYHEAREQLKQHGVVVGDVRLDIPTMMARKESIVKQLSKGIEGLLKKNKIQTFHGMGRLDGPGQVLVDGEETHVLSADHIIIATGGNNALIQGIDIDHKMITMSNDALAYTEVPKHLIVIGAGYVGLELGSVWRRLGAKVTILEYLERILPGMDSEVARAAYDAFRKQGIEFRLGSQVMGAHIEGDEVVVEIKRAEPVRGDRVLLAVGRVPFTERLGLETVWIELDERGRIPVNERFETSANGVYAIGDVIRGPMLAHKAEEEGIAVVDWIATGYGHVNYDCIPAVVFTNPEIASVGKTEDELRQSDVPYHRGVFPFKANGRAVTLAQGDGFVKILSHAETDRILGVHIIGPRAGDLIHEAAAAIEFGATAEDLARMCHAHPTLAETVREAALAVDGRTIHY